VDVGFVDDRDLVRRNQRSAAEEVGRRAGNTDPATRG